MYLIFPFHFSFSSVTTIQLSKLRRASNPSFPYPLLLFRASSLSYKNALHLKFSCLAYHTHPLVLYPHPLRIPYASNQGVALTPLTNLSDVPVPVKHFTNRQASIEKTASRTCIYLLPCFFHSLTNTSHIIYS